MSKENCQPDLTPTQDQAIILLAAGTQKRQVAESVGVTPGTISEWLKNSIFIASLSDEKKCQRVAARDAVQALGYKAIGTLADVLENGQRDADRLRAAQYVIDKIDGASASGISPNFVSIDCNAVSKAATLINAQYERHEKET